MNFSTIEPILKTLYSQKQQHNYYNPLKMKKESFVSF